MSLIYEERLSDSPYVENVTWGHTTGEGVVIRPAECHWHMVFVKYNGSFNPLMVGPLTSSGVVNWIEGLELLWIRFKIGTFIPHLPTKNIIDIETPLPEAGSSHSFWLKGSAWQFPNYENVDTFVNRLGREELLVTDPVVSTALRDHPQDVAERTVRHRFQHVTGLSQNHIRQVERAKRAETLLRQGMSILDTVYEAGYFDQPHMTRALKQFVGYTPAQLARMSQVKSCDLPQEEAILLVENQYSY
jgi:hypothetical protein